MNEPLKLDYILKIAAAYFNEIAMQDYAVDRDCSRSIKSPYYLSIYCYQSTLLFRANIILQTFA